MAYINLSYTHIISYTQYAVHSIIMYTMLNREFTVSSRLHNNIPANIIIIIIITIYFAQTNKLTVKIQLHEQVRQGWGQLL